MKNWFLLAGFMIVFAAANAQQDTTALFRRFPSIPPVSLLRADGSILSKDGLKRNQPVLLMYFSPECHHCQHQMEDMIKRMNELKKIQIVLATYQPMEELLSFEKKYNLKQYSNIRAGRDTRFFIVPFFKIRNLPYLALYDKKGNLITTFEGNVKVDKLIESFGTR